jgi:hypothetical protein
VQQHKDQDFRQWAPQGRLRGLFAFAVADRSIPLKRNPAKAYLKSKKKGRFHTWTTKEVAIYLERHGPGAKALLALGSSSIQTAPLCARMGLQSALKFHITIRCVEFRFSSVPFSLNSTLRSPDAAALMGDCFACGLLS